MEQKIQEAQQSRAERATNEANDWLNKVAQKLEEANITLQSGYQLERGDIISRYLVGKKAKKTVEDISKLREEGISTTLTYPPPPPSMATLPHGESMELESRRRIRADIMESLKDEHVRMIAICGPGGVGKTTMVRGIKERMRNELFDEVVIVLVSQQMDMLKIQKEIAEILGLDLREATLVGRAHKICTRLLDSKKKLVIFDDVWKSFDMNDIGVPFGNGCAERCKIIFTSRLRHICDEMEADKVVQIKVLDDQESWKLFRDKSGVREDDSELHPIAKNVAAECKGLPIALVPIAKALKNKHICTWEDSLLQLQRANPNNFPKVLEDVYKPLKLSYDFLETESEKSIFLLCCLFPEDCDIPIELLTLYSIGLGILEGIRNIHEARNRTHHLVDRLKSSFLLMDGSEGVNVKIHDVVRDVAIFICSKEKHGFLKSLQVSSMDSPRLDSSCDCQWMSIDISNVNAELPVGPAFQNLRLLMISESSYQFGSHINSGDIDFQGMEELKVLCFSGIDDSSFSTIPELPKSLKTLLLFDVSKVKDISVVGKLTSLEILCIHSCHSIEELPTDIGRLNRLRLFDLRDCKNVKRVAKGVISSLVRLEELKIVGGFDQWGEKVKGSEERNAGLLELESLPYLTCLEIDVSDSNWVAQDIRLSQHLVRYRILFTESEHEKYGMGYERSIYLYLDGDIEVGNWIQQLVRSTQSLLLKGDGSSYFNLAEIKSLKKLMLCDCSTVEFMVDGTIPEGCNFFQELEILCVDNMPKLAHLWRIPNHNVSLPNLKKTWINDCASLRALFPLETARSLVQLQLLYISNCGKIEQIFIESKIEDEILQLPRLTGLQVIDCPKLSCKMGKCPNLQTFSLHNFNGLHCLPSSRLCEISVRGCDTIAELFVDEEGNRHMIFPELEFMSLADLPCLTTLYRGVESIKFPKLEMMKVANLPRLNKLAPMDSEPTHDDRCIHFFCNGKVEFSCLKALTMGELQDTTNKIWCRLVPNIFFRKLERLEISHVNGIRNLLSSSIAKNLVNLNDLSIHSCQEMIEVVEDDKEICVTSLFPKLTSISIRNLRKLKSFCLWKNALEFPSLRSVDIYGCPVMETFTLGPLSILHDFKLNINDVRFIEKDLIGGLRDHFKAEN